MADLAENARRKAQGKKPAVISPLALEAACSMPCFLETSKKPAPVSLAMRIIARRPSAELESENRIA